jgi:hypothetical protein
VYFKGVFVAVIHEAVLVMLVTEASFLWWADQTKFHLKTKADLAPEIVQVFKAWEDGQCPGL